MDKIYLIAGWLSVALYWVIVAGVSLRIALKRRAVGVSAAWLLIIFILPLFGVALYLLFGEANLGRSRRSRALQIFSGYRDWFQLIERDHRQYQGNMGPNAHPIHALCFNQLGIPSTLGNDLTLISTPDDIFDAIIKDIGEAQRHLQLEFYIWHPGGRADEVAEALIAASERGVEVYLLLDASGSRDFFRTDWPKRMRQSGIQVSKALAVNMFRMFLRRMDLRQHRKIITIDHQIGYTGSMNLVDPRCFKQGAGVGEWIDVMVRVTGPAVPTLAALQAWDWQVEGGDCLLDRLPTATPPLGSANHNHTVQVIPSGPALPETVIQKTLLLGIFHARRSVTLCTPYFVPSEHLMEALVTAAQSGIRVDLILPDKNDSTMVEWASRSYFEELLRAGVRIYRFQGGLLHTKAVLIDDDHCLIGTVNLDMRSLQLNSEVTLAVDDPDFCSELTELMASYRNHSYQLDHHLWQQRPLNKKLTEQFFYMFAPLL
ncbi:cardiolipin synthase [Ferrimonas marina]|uniref:Cardiolipin synthase A n=1 Tax=Ferrimonas marina TaxID=299255 RepID=A0A1M5Z3Y9_9GAMM|nr:cardiolipin synthase [Ferrimonas marina]SHI18996.1 cardiolipin synthase [Ferrimonas marina]